MSDLENFLLETLSFYEAMTFSNIVLDLDPVKLKHFNKLDQDEFLAVLKVLEKKKLIKKVIVNQEVAWI